MKKTLVSILFFLISFIFVFAHGNYEPGVILLKVREPNVVQIIDNHVMNGSTQLEVIFEQYGIKGSRKLVNATAYTDGWYRVEFPLDAPLDVIQSVLEECPDVKYATLNYYGILSEIPDDPLWTEQWALYKIRIPEAWDYTKPENTILIGIMDDGLDYTHEDLIDNIWHNIDELPGDGNDDGCPGVCGEGNDVRGDIYFLLTFFI